MADSDGGASAGAAARGAGGRSWWIWIGGGCAVVFLIAAVLFAFGAYRGITCCQQAIEDHGQVQEASLAFAGSLRQRADEQAYERLTESYRRRASLEAFVEAVEPHREAMQGAVAQPMGMHRQFGSSGAGESGNYWRVTVGFLRSEAEEILAMTLRLIPVEEGGETSFRVGRMDFERRRRREIEEPPPRIVRQFAVSLAKGRRESAEQFVATPGSESESARVWEVVDANPQIFETETVEIRDVGYEVGGEAVVEADHVGADGGVQPVRYALARRDLSWRITEIELQSAPSPGGSASEPDGPETGRGEAEPGAGADVDGDGTPSSER